MSDLPGAAPEAPSLVAQAEKTNLKVTEADKVRLFKKAIDTLYGDKPIPAFKKKGPRLSGLKEIAEWRDSDEVKGMGVGAKLVQGLEADEAGEKEKAKEPVEKPEPAPTKGEDDKTPEPAPPPQSEEVIVPPALKTDFGVGIVSDPTRIEQEIAGLAQHDRAREKPARGFLRSLFTSVTNPREFFRNLWQNALFTPVTNPREFFRNLWQNTLFKGSFDARSMSFSRTMMEIARSGLSGLDTSIPFEMPQEILDLAVLEGRKIKRGEQLPTKALNVIKDTFSGVFAVTQNSDMKYAENWFKEHGRELVDNAKKISINEQTELGERFAIKGDDKDVISKEIGEVRYKLEEAIPDKAAREGLQAKIKELIGQYGQKQINDEELLKRFNQYYNKEIVPKIDPAKQKEIEGIEVSSNVLRIAWEMIVEDKVTKDTVKTRYQRYQDEKADDGETMWNKLHFDIYLGRGKYEVARGEVKLSGLEKSLIHRMVERDYKIANDLIGNSAVEMLSDLGIYGLAYSAGGMGAAAMAGRSAFNLGGFVGISTVAAAREGILVSNKGKLYGLRGKAVTDFEQVSRETATGRQSMNKAKLRPMFEKAMVDQKHANELTAPIIELVQKGKLTETEQKQLLQELAHAKARLTLTDLSTKKGRAILDLVGEISVAQNFIGYSQDTRNAEMTALRAAIVQGGVKLAIENPALYGKLSQAQAVYEAQLKIGSFENKLMGTIAKDLGIKQDEAITLVSEFYQDLGIDNKSRKSLYVASRTLAGVVDRRAATTAAFAAVVSPIIGAELRVLGEGVAGVKALATGNLDSWAADWGEVVKGEVPLTYDQNHNLVSNLSPLQKDALFMHNIIEPPPITAHTEMIDGVAVTLPGGVQHGYVAGNPDADALIDTKTGEILVHMDKSHLAYEDLNGDGQLEMVVKTNDGQTFDATIAFGKFNGIKLVQDANLSQTTTSTEAIFEAQPQSDQTITVDGKPVTINVPGNTHWQEDAVTGKWDLIGQKADGSPITLIDDATIKNNGEIITTGAVINPGIHIETGQPIETAGPGHESIWNHSNTYRVVWGDADKYQPDQDYVFSTGDNSHPYGIEVRFLDDNVRNTNNGEITSLNQHYEDGSLGFILQVKGLNGVNDGHVLVTDAFDRTTDDFGRTYFSLKLDPTSDRLVTIVDGGTEVQVPMSQLAQQVLNEPVLAEHSVGNLASETQVETMNVFNLANEGERGHFWMGFITDGDPKGYDTIVGDNGQSQIFMPVHMLSGSNPIIEPTGEVAPPETSFSPVITVEDITSQTTQTDPGYRIEYENPQDLWSSFLTPVPMRQNIEKSVSGEKTSSPPKFQPAATTPPAKPEEKKPGEPGETLEDKRQGTMKKESLTLKTLKADELQPGNEVKGTVEGAIRVTDEKKNQVPVEIYENKEGKSFIRALSPDWEPKIKSISEDGTVRDIAADAGLSITDKDRFYANLMVFKLEDGIFKRVSKAEEDKIRAIKEIVEFEASFFKPKTEETKQEKITVKEAKAEIYEKAGKRTKEEMTKLIDEVHNIHYAMIEKGVGKLPENIQEAEKLGFKEIICDGFVTYIPKGKGELVIVGDLHGDFTTLKQILDKKQFIENMEEGDGSMVAVFEGDYLDRGKKDVELMEALLELKRRYPKNIVLMKADHEVMSGVSGHDSPARVKAHYNDEKLFEYLNNQVFEILPRTVFCGNGVVMVHGGPTYDDLNLKDLTRLRNREARAVFDKGMTWADPEIMSEEQLEANRKKAKSLIDEIEIAFAKAEKSPTKIVSFHGADWHSDNLHRLRTRIETAANNGFWFNPNRIDTGDLIDAAWGNVVVYSEKGLEYFLSKTGSKVMIRAHQVSDSVDGGKPNPFSKNIFWTIHSTGKGSEDSYYKYQEFAPRIAVFDRSIDVNEINPDENIVKIW